MNDVLKELVDIGRGTESLYKNVLKERKTLVDTWGKYGLLENLRNTEKLNMVQLLENQRLQLIREANTTSDITGFQNIALPLVRRVFGGLLANKLVSVQPMSLPSGLVFYLDYKYATGKGVNYGKAGTQDLQWVEGRSIYGDPLANQIQASGASAAGGHFDLQSGYTRYERTASGTVTTMTSGSVSNWVDVGYDPDLSASVTAGAIWYTTFDMSDATTYPNIDETMYKNFAVSGTATAHWDNVKAIYRRHNQWNPTTKVLTVYYSSSTALKHFASASMTVSYVQGPTQTVSAVGSVFNPEFESNFQAGYSQDIIPEIDIALNAINVQAVTRKLRAKWTPEVAQDLNAYQAIDAEAELTTVLSEQIAMDIDAEILGDLLNKAVTTQYWSRAPGVFVNKDTGVEISGPTFTGNVTEWYWTLLERINDVSNQIHKKTLRGAANFLVVSPEIATIFESMVLFKPVMSFEPNELQFSVGAEKIGTLSSRYQVYKCVYFPKNVILVGYKGNSYLETGYVYAPYIPLIVSPTIHHPESFTPTKGVMTRYGKVCIRPDFFGKVLVKNL